MNFFTPLFDVFSDIRFETWLFFHLLFLLFTLPERGFRDLDGCTSLVSITFCASIEQSSLKQIFLLEMRMNMHTQIPPEDKNSAPDLIFSSVKNTLGRG